MLSFNDLMLSNDWLILSKLAANEKSDQHSFFSFLHYLIRCIFVVGHDCGHGNFSESETLNDIIGHITHGSIMVPYYPWQLSHRRHHMYHNHIDKDYSHPW